MRTTLFIMFALAAAACGDDGNKAADAAVADAPATPDAAAATLDCASYCSEVQTNCTGTFQQYAAATDCMAACTKFETNKGTLADTSMPTLGCRIYHAGAPSKMTPATHCVHAGPAGADNSTAGNSVCGSACENFCTLAIGACPTAFTDRPACLTACAGFPLGDKYNSSIKTGNTLACRLYHVTAAQTAPTPHCGHIGTVSPTCM